MKIAQITCTYPPYKGGIGNVAQQFSRELSKSGHEVTIITPQYSTKQRDENEGDNTKVLRIKPLFSFGNAAILNKISKILKDFDAIHLHYPFFGTAIFVCRMKKKHPEKKLVITYHMDAINRGLKGVVFWVYAKTVMPIILASADKITVSSLDYIKHSEAKNIYKKFPEKFIELPFTVDTNIFKPTGKDKILMNKLSIHPENKVILFVGGLDKAHYFKGLGLLIEAFGKIIKSKPKFKTKLIIIGEGELKNHYKKIVNKHNLVKQITFKTAQSKTDLAIYYNICDLFVLPSTNRAEAFGLVLLEAMACKKATIASDLPGVRTLTTNKQLSIFETNDHLDLSKKILFLLNNNSIRDQIANNNYQKVINKYSQNRIKQIFTQTETL